MKSSAVVKKGRAPLIAVLAVLAAGCGQESKTPNPGGAATPAATPSSNAAQIPSNAGPLKDIAGKKFYCSGISVAETIFKYSSGQFMREPDEIKKLREANQARVDKNIPLPADYDLDASTRNTFEVSIEFKPDGSYAFGPAIYGSASSSNTGRGLFLEPYLSGKTGKYTFNSVKPSMAKPEYKYNEIDMTIAGGGSFKLWQSVGNEIFWNQPQYIDQGPGNYYAAQGVMGMRAKNKLASGEEVAVDIELMCETQASSKEFDARMAAGYQRHLQEEAAKAKPASSPAQSNCIDPPINCASYQASYDNAMSQAQQPGQHGLIGQAGQILDTARSAGCCWTKKH